MRVTHSMLGSQSVFNLKRSLMRVGDYRLQLSSGRRLNSYADDPRGVGNAQRYSTLLARNDQYQRNTSAASTFLDATDTALQGMMDIFNEIRSLVIEQTGPIANDDTQDGAALRVRRLREMLLDLANQEVQGSHIFAGFRTGEAPFKLDGSDVLYLGDDNAQRVQLSAGMQIDVGIPGSELLGADIATLHGVGDYLPRLTAGTALSALNQGAGFGGGSVEFTDGFGESVEVDLSGAATVGDVLTAINAATAAAVPPVDITARLSDDETAITLEGTGPLAVAEIGGGTAARELGIIGTRQGDTLIGEDIRVALDDAIDFSELASLDAALPLGVLRFELPSGTVDVDLSSASTLADVRTEIQALIPDMDVQINGGAISLVYDRPEAFEVFSPAGDSTAQDLGIQGAASPSRLFDVFERVIAALESHDGTALRQTLTEIGDVHGRVSAMEIDIGSRQNIVSRAQSFLADRAVSLTQRKSEVEDVDIIEAASRLTFAETTYEAALLATSRVYELSLARFI